MLQTVVTLSRPREPHFNVFLGWTPPCSVQCALCWHANTFCFIDRHVEMKNVRMGTWFPVPFIFVFFEPNTSPLLFELAPFVVYRQEMIFLCSQMLLHGTTPSTI